MILYTTFPLFFGIAYYIFLSKLFECESVYGYLIQPILIHRACYLFIDGKNSIRKIIKLKPEIP